MLHDRIAELHLDTAHFKGKGWNRGQSVTCWKGRPLEEILVRNSEYRTTSSLRRRLVKEGLKEERCEVCGITEWNGQPAPLQLDHITETDETTGWKTFGYSVQTATRRPIHGVARTMAGTPRKGACRKGP